MAILRMCPNAWHIKEFYGGFNGTCTQASAAMCLASALGAPKTHDDVVNLMLTMTHDMIGRAKTDPVHGAGDNGAATVVSMAYELRQKGATTSTEWDYAGDVMPHDWISLLRAQAGAKPILLQLANAQGLWDVTGHGEDAGVHYHAIAILGIANEGYVVGDPNNPTVESTFDIYSYGALLAASPCGLIMLDVKTAPKPPPPPAPAPDAAQIKINNFKAALTAITS